MKSPRAAMPPARLPPPVVASALAGVFTSVLAGVFTSAAAGEPGPWLDPGAASPQPVQAAVALLQPPGGAQPGVAGPHGASPHGEVYFEQGEQGLRVTAHVQGLPAGTHAYHVHLRGDCSGEAGKSAGPHFNFSGPSAPPPDDVGRITGNLGELRADEGGRARHQGRIADASLTGRYRIVGRAVVVHAKGNDPEQPPDGAAGARLACGVIGLTEPR